MPRKKTKSGSTGMGGSLSGDARRLASEMKAYHRSLLTERTVIDQRLCAVGEAIEALGAPAPSVAAAAPKKRGRGRPPGRSAGRPVGRPVGRPAGRRATAGTRPGSLKAHIGQVLTNAGAPVSVKDITRGVVRSGYKTKSKTLGNQVSAAISEMKLKKVGRGMYKL